MADAPKRLWLWPAEPEGGADKGVSFPDQPYPSGSTEYTRADVARADAELAVAEAIRRAVEAVEVIPRRKEPISGQTVSYVDLAETVLTILTLAPADVLAEVQQMRDAVEALVVVLDRNDKKGPIPDVEMMFCWLASQGVRAAFRKIAQKGEAT